MYKIKKDNKHRNSMNNRKSLTIKFKVLDKHCFKKMSVKLKMKNPELQEMN
jgi:hypothetical protein